MILDEVLLLKDIVEGRTTGVSSSEYANVSGARGALFIIKVSSINAVTPSITNIKIDVACEKNSITYKTIYTLAPTAPIDATGNFVLLIYPDALDTAGFDGTPVKGCLPYRFRVTTTHGDADQINYSLTMQTLA